MEENKQQEKAPTLKDSSFEELIMFMYLALSQLSQTKLTSVQHQYLGNANTILAEMVQRYKKS